MQLALRPGERDRIAGRIGGLPPRLTPSFVEGSAHPLADTGVIYAALFADGYHGDLAAATVEAGEALLAGTVDSLAAFYARFAAARLRVGEP